METTEREYKNGILLEPGCDANNVTPFTCAGCERCYSQGTVFNYVKGGWIDTYRAFDPNDMNGNVYCAGDKTFTPRRQIPIERAERQLNSTANKTVRELNLRELTDMPLEPELMAKAYSPAKETRVVVAVA